MDERIEDIKKQRQRQIQIQRQRRKNIKNNLKRPDNQKMNMKDCIYFFQKSYDLLSISYRVENDTIMFNIKTYISVENPFNIKVIDRKPYEKFSDIFILFYNIIEYNISITEFNIYFNNVLFKIDSHQMDNINLLDKDERSNIRDYRANFLTELDINRSFGDLLKVYLLYREDSGYSLIKSTSTNDSINLKDKNIINPVLEDILYWISIKTNIQLPNDISSSSIPERVPPVKLLQDKINKRKEFLNRTETFLLLQNLRVYRTEDPRENSIILDSLRKIKVRQIYSKIMKNEQLTNTRQGSSKKQGSIELRTSSKKQGNNELPVNIDYFDIKQYFFDTQGNLIFTPADSMKEYLLYPKIKDKSIIHICTYYKNIKNKGKNILLIGEAHGTPIDDTIFTNFCRNLIRVNYENNSCLNLFIESIDFPEDSITETNDLLSVNNQSIKKINEFRRGTDKRKGGFLTALYNHYIHFQSKGTQFHSTNIRDSYKGIKNYIIKITHVYKYFYYKDKNEHKKYYNLFSNDFINFIFKDEYNEVIYQFYEKLYDKSKELMGSFEAFVHINNNILLEFIIENVIRPMKENNSFNFFQEFYKKSKEFIDKFKTYQNHVVTISMEMSPIDKQILLAQELQIICGEEIDVETSDGYPRFQNQKYDFKYNKAVTKLDTDFFSFDDILSFFSTLGDDHSIKLYIMDVIMDIYTICRMFRKFDSTKTRFPSCDKEENHLKNIIYYSGAAHTDLIRRFIDQKLSGLEKQVFLEDYIPLNFPYFDYPRNSLLDWYPILFRNNQEYKRISAKEQETLIKENTGEKGKNSQTMSKKILTNINKEG